MMHSCPGLYQGVPAFWSLHILLAPAQQRRPRCALARYIDGCAWARVEVEQENDDEKDSRVFLNFTIFRAESAQADIQCGYQ